MPRYADITCEDWVNEELSFLQYPHEITFLKKSDGSYISSSQDC